MRGLKIKDLWWFTLFRKKRPKKDYRKINYVFIPKTDTE